MKKMTNEEGQGCVIFYTLLERSYRACLWKSLKICIMLPRKHNVIYISHGKERQGCESVLSLGRMAVRSLPLESLCPFHGPRKTMNLLFIISFLHSTENAIIDSFLAKKRLIKSLLKALISHNNHEQLVSITVN